MGKKFPKHLVRGEMLVVTLSCAICILLAFSIGLFLTDPNHRLGGVAWNVLFLVLLPLLIMAYSVITAANTLSGKLRLTIGMPAAIIPFVMAIYCAYRSWPIIMSA